VTFVVGEGITLMDRFFRELNAFFDACLCFQVINLSRNSIRSMKGLQNHSLLQEIDLEENQVSD